MLRSLQESGGSSGKLEFESLVTLYYETLYRFAFSLTRSEADACDLTQQTFYVWATKGNQVKDETKIKTWLFTTLHRMFLRSRRRQSRFPHFEISQVDSDLLQVTPAREAELDTASLHDALAKIDQIFRGPVALFYLENCAYKDVARILGVPMGTVKSRIARGIAQLQKLLLEDAGNHAQPSPSPLKKGRGPGRRVRNSPPRDYPYFFAATLEAAA
jgi:RNA polymerase sigma-70 factor (ECF subfamily)